MASKRAARTRLGTQLVVQPTGGAPRVAVLEDLSESGACLATNAPLGAGEAVVVYLPHPSKDRPTAVTAVVRWTTPERMGVQFSGVDAVELDALRALASAPRSAPRLDGPGSADDPFGRDALLAVPDALVSVTRNVRFQEVDAAGTIYYSRVFEYFGDCYVELLERGGVSVPAIMAQQAWFAPLVHAEAAYLAPMRFGDAVTVSIVRVKAGTSAATVGYRIVSPEGRGLAVGHTVHVWVDTKTFRPCPIPSDVRAAFGAGQRA